MELHKQVEMFVQTKEFKQHLENNDFHSIYQEFIDSCDSDGDDDAEIGNLTELFYSFDIDPLEYLDVVPYGFLYNANMQGIPFRIPYGIESIESWAFAGVRGLSTIVVPDSVTEIYNSAISYCKDLAHLEIGTGIQKLGSYVFSGNDQLMSISYKGTAAQWDSIDKDSGWDTELDHPKIVCKDGVLVMEDDKWKFQKN